MISLRVDGDKALVKALKQLERKIATKILKEELRTTAKQVVAIVKPLIPKDTGFLRRSATVRAVKKKKRYTYAYRVFMRPPKEKKYYAFAPEFGVTKGKGGRGNQPARHYLQKGVEAGRALIGPTKARIWQRIQQAWNTGK